MWTKIEDGFPDGIGSEGGFVRLDEEHSSGARITLEEGGLTARWSITCGIYGWMFHTVFCSSEPEGLETFQRMKDALDTILDIIPANDDPNVDAKTRPVTDAIEKFVAAFP